MAVAAMPVIAAGLVALIFGWALWQTFAPLLRAGLSGVPVIGGWIVQQTDNMLWAVWRTVAPWANSALYAVHDLVLIPIVNLADVLNLNTDGLAKLHGQHWWTVHHRIPDAMYKVELYAASIVSQAMDYAQQLVAGAIAYARALHDQEVQFTQQQVASAIAYAQQLHQQAIDWARALSDQDVRFAEQLERQAIGYAQALSDADLRFTEQVGRQAIDYARALQQEAIDYDGALHRQAIEYTDQVGALAEGYARALNDQAIAYAGAAAGAVAAEVEAIRRSPCLQHCGPLGDLGGLLQDLEDVGFAALLVALVGEAVHDPGAVLGETRAVAVPAVQAAGHLVGDLVGIGGRG